ncbi:Bromodomain-containing protein [Zychaea mexicana]|uniref:Bromodomain-containing protein n=1 Tax=Zychaea mexicana TaxID=64656 RepID=UPI0022FEE1A8|nr:Bromodomain-containing protein [Zychaea mexicana]KAI9467879.1 Bromodomain-containing protein [Zychaea mexicana]
MLSTMEGRPKRQSATEKNYRERKRIRKEREGDQQTGDSSNNNEPQLLPDIVQEQCRQLYKAIKEYPDPDEPEYFLSTLFAQLPSKRQYPDYFEVIKNPIALSNIKTKIDQQEYKSVGDLKADIDLMVSNAKKYNIKESQVYQDAIKIHKLVKHWRPDGQDKSHSHSKKNSPKEKSSSATSSPADENKGKTVLKLPGGAFGIRQQQPPSQPQHQQLTSPPQQQHVKAIRLKAVDKQSKKRTVPLPELMDAIGRSDGKKALELLETDPAINVNELMEVEMFGDKFKWGPLHAACYYGDVKVVQALVNMGANVELNDTWYSATPLGWAAFGGLFSREKRVPKKRYLRYLIHCLPF